MASGSLKNETSATNRSASSSTASLQSSIDSTDEKLLKDQQEHNHKKNHHHKDHDIPINKIDKYQLEISVIFIVVIFLANKFEQFKPYTTKFLTLQHKDEETNTYDIGWDDSYFVLYWIFIVTFFRAAVNNYFLRPLATHVFNLHNKKIVQKFKEQGWFTIYYSISFLFGFYIYYNSSYYGNFDNLYIDWPHDKFEPIFKKYYLIELACWLQQIFILEIEAKRKDHIQMFSHHIITCSLIIGSYYYYFTRIGNVILVMMDFVDIIFAMAKITKYCGYQRLCDVLFLIFVISWIVVRHGLYNYVFYHAATKARSLMEPGRCVAGLIQKRCYTDNVIKIFLSLLGGLQIITIIWMYLILKVVVKVVTGKGADDVRSDDEDEDDD